MIPRIQNALVLLLAAAIVLRLVAAEILEPALPFLIVIGLLVYILSLLFDRNGGSS